MHESQRLLTEASIDRMETPTSTLAAKNDLNDGYGLNNYTKTHQGYYWHGHNGGMMGFVADLTYQPDLGVGFVVMINKSSGALNQLSARIQEYLLQGIEKPDLPADIPMNPDAVEKYTGYYRSATTRNQFSYLFERLPFMRVKFTDTHFVVTSIPGSSFNSTPVEGGLYRHGKRWMATELFFEDDEGKRYFQNGAFGNFKKVSGFCAWGQFLLAIVCVLLMLSSLILIPVYGIGRLVGKFKDVDDWWIRLIPAVSVIVLLLTFAISAFIVTSNQRMFDHFGSMTFLSLSLYLLDWVFVGLAVFGFYKIIQTIRLGSPIHAFAKYYLLAVSLGSMFYIGYTLYWNPWVPMWMY